MRPQEYSDDSLAGYADKNYTKGGKDLQHQQRGLILPILEKHLKRVNVEIGTGNGDVIADLADKYPDRLFIGVDFSVKNATEKHNKKNLVFIEGYALDLLEKDILKGDLVFASSTFCLFTPDELVDYIKLLKIRGFTSIVLNEPTWNGRIQENNEKITSSSLEGPMYHHNWAGYFRWFGYEITDFSFFHYIHPLSKRADIYVCIICGEA
jgi:hypothetical protein